MITTADNIRSGCIMISGWVKCPQSASKRNLSRLGIVCDARETEVQSIFRFAPTYDLVNARHFLMKYQSHHIH